MWFWYEPHKTRWNFYVLLIVLNLSRDKMPITGRVWSQWFLQLVCLFIVLWRRKCDTADSSQLVWLCTKTRNESAGLGRCFSLWTVQSQMKLVVILTSLIKKTISIFSTCQTAPLSLISFFLHQIFPHFNHIILHDLQLLLSPHLCCARWRMWFVAGNPIKLLTKPLVQKENLSSTKHAWLPTVFTICVCCLTQRQKQCFDVPLRAEASLISPVTTV